MAHSGAGHRGPPLHVSDFLHCIEVHRQHALEAGVTEQELAEAIYVAAALRAGGAIGLAAEEFQEADLRTVADRTEVIRELP